MTSLLQTVARRSLSMGNYDSQRKPGGVQPRGFLLTSHCAGPGSSVKPPGGQKTLIIYTRKHRGVRGRAAPAMVGEQPAWKKNLNNLYLKTLWGVGADSPHDHQRICYFGGGGRDFPPPNGGTGGGRGGCGRHAPPHNSSEGRGLEVVVTKRDGVLSRGNERGLTTPRDNTPSREVKSTSSPLRSLPLAPVEP